MKVLDKHVGIVEQRGQICLAVGSLGIESKRFFIGVELEIIVAGKIGVELKFLTGGIAYTGTLDFDNVGAKPSKKLSTGRAGLYFGEVNYLNTLKRGSVHNFENLRI